MATIDDIIAAVEAVPVTNSSLTLSATDFADIAVVQSLFSSVLESPTFTFAGATKTPGTGEITVAGQAAVLGYPGVEASLRFTTVDGPGRSGAAPALGRGVAITLTGTVESKVPKPLPVIDWISVTDVSVAATVAEPFNAVTYGFGAALVLSGQPTGTIPITLVQNGTGVWTLAVAEQTGQSVTAEQLVELLGGTALTDLLPSELVTELEGLALSDLEISFDPVGRTVSGISAGVTATNGWGLTDELALKPGLMLSLSIQNPSDSATRAVSAAVTGTVVIDTIDVPVFVQVGVAGGTSTWLVGLDPASDGVTLPSLSGLFTLAGGASLTESLPPALAQLPGIQINPMLIGFTLSPGAFQSFDFAAKTTSPWPIIDGFLTIDKLSFALTLAALDQPTKTVGGSLSAILQITTDVWLYFICVKDPASDLWTFSGGLPPNRPLNLTDLIAKLLSPFVAIPASAPALVLNAVDVTVVPGTSMTFSAGSTTPWKLLDGLTLDLFRLTFDYTDGQDDPFTGALETTMEVAQVPLAISAGLDKSGSWSFSGGTAKGAKIDVAHLISDLTGTFDVPAVPEDALGGLTISDLSVSFASGDAAGRPGKFHFGCAGTFEVAETELDIKVAIDLASAATGYTGTFTGDLAIKKADQTTEDIKVTLDGSELTAQWTASKGHELSLTDLVVCFGLTDLPPIPSAVNLTLTAMSFAYDVTTSSLAIGATTMSGDKAVFLSAPVGETGAQEQRFGFAVDLPLGIKLADIPLVGDKLPHADQLGIPDLGCWVVSGDLAGTGATSDAAVLNAIVPKGYPTLPEVPMAAGLLLFGKLLLGSDIVPLELALAGSATAQSQGMLTAGAAPATGNGAPARAAGASPPTTKWFSVQQAFGVFTLARVGIQYDGTGGGTLFFLMDASIELGPLEMSTQGLGIGSPLTTFTPKFHLDGLGVAYDQPPLEIAGAFLAVPSEQLAPDVNYQYDGFAIVKVSDISLAAVGSYAQLTSGDPSLFIFAQLEAPLGGPPVFFVTGLMGGFGYNRSIEMPTQDEVLGFPLLVLGAPPAPGKTAPPQGMTDVLAILEGTQPIAPGGTAKRWIAPKTGDYWLAVGIEFSSFELVNTKALLIAEFGQDLALALLGVSTLRLPPDVPDAETYAYIELEIEAVLLPNQGVFGLTALLGPSSYVISPSCHITGGFAFYVWFGSNPHAGQFVITLGGYHPAFKVPDYFPSEPRLGFSWAVSDEVVIKGDAYFALTSSCVMAGGGLSITFESGNLKAWFIAQMDVLISWNPFFFLADIGLSIGVSYKLDLGFVSKTITVELGADLSLWGPPTGGTVTVHLWIFSFTVDFGTPQGTTSNEPLAPAEFAALLPPPETLLAISATDGLTQSLTGGTWCVRPSQFVFATGSAIPVTVLAYGGPNGSTTTTDTGFALNVRPMDLTGTAATQTVTIAHADGTAPIDLTTWTPKTVTHTVPQTLWGKPLTDQNGEFTQLPQQAGADTVPGAPVGASFSCPAPVLGPTPGAVPESALAFEAVSAPGSKAVDPRTPLAVGAEPSSAGLPTVSSDALKVVEQVAQTAATQARTPILAALAAAETLGSPLYAGPTSDLSGLAALVNDAFTAQPMLAGAT